MQIRSILTPGSIVANSKASGKKRLFKEISVLGETQFGIKQKALLDAIEEREALGSTAMGSGVAIPHARIEGLVSVKGIFLKLEEAIDYDAIDQKPVDLVFALFAPMEAGADHLKALARVSRILRNFETREKLRSTGDIEAIFAILTEHENSVAA